MKIVVTNCELNNDNFGGRNQWQSQLTVNKC